MLLGWRSRGCLALLVVIAGCTGCQVRTLPAVSPTAAATDVTPTPTVPPVVPTATQTASATETSPTTTSVGKATAMPTTTGTAKPAPDLTGQHAYSMTLQVAETGGTTTVEMDYLLYLPGGYGRDAGTEWPLILFLHGDWERGDDPWLLVAQGLPKLLAAGTELPGIVASPQCPAGQRWWRRTAILAAYLDQLQMQYAVDRTRIYLTGISSGAFGAWAIALREPDRFAALVPIAGGAAFSGNDIPMNICDLKDVPTWVFHGDLDLNVSVVESIRSVEAMGACGADVRFTRYPDAAHTEAWERAYDDPDLYTWLFAQKRER
jgi:predicted peptidase